MGIFHCYLWELLSLVYDVSTNSYYIEIFFTESIAGTPIEDLILEVDQDGVLILRIYMDCNFAIP